MELRILERDFYFKMCNKIKILIFDPSINSSKKKDKNIKLKN